MYWIDILWLDEFFDCGEFFYKEGVITELGTDYSEIDNRAVYDLAPDVDWLFPDFSPS